MNSAGHGGHQVTEVSLSLRVLETKPKSNKRPVFPAKALASLV